MRNQKLLTFLKISLLLFIIHVCTWAAQQEEIVYDNDVHVMSFQEMNYPPLAREGRIQSTVVVRVLLDDGGKVKSATAISGAKLLISDTLANIETWQFRPAAGKSAVIIYEFRLADGKCDSKTSHMFIFHPPNVATVIGCGETWQP